MLARQLADPVRWAELDVLLVVDASLGRTPLAWLGAGATTSSPAAVKTELSGRQWCLVLSGGPDGGHGYHDAAVANRETIIPPE